MKKVDKERLYDVERKAKLVAFAVFEACGEDCDLLVDTVRSLVRANQLGIAARLCDYALVAFPGDSRLVEVYKEIPVAFDAFFYDRWSEDAEKSSLIMLNLLKNYSNFESVVDVGAGTGAWLKSAYRLGATQLLGIEGVWVKNLPRYRYAEYLFADLNSGINLTKKYDLAICVEVAEHLNHDRGKSLVDDICKLSKIVIFGAALPRQLGDGHINCRNQEYWITLFKFNGFKCYDLFRTKLWHNGEVLSWYRQNTFLYVSEETSTAFDEVPAPSLLNIYQPSLLYSPVHKYVSKDHDIT